MEKLTDLQIAGHLLDLNKKALGEGKKFGVKFTTMKKVMNRKTCTFSGLPLGGENKRKLVLIEPKFGYVDPNIIAIAEGVDEVYKKFNSKALANIAKKLKNVEDAKARIAASQIKKNG